MDQPDGHFRAERLDIQIDEPIIPKSNRDIPKLKLYNMNSLPQKIQLWLIVFLSLGSLLSNNILSIISNFRFKSQNTCSKVD